VIRNKKNIVKVFGTIELLDLAAAQLIVDIAKKSIAERGRFVFCLSGGNTPKELYHLLSTKPWRDKIPWEHTFIFWSDERCVPLTDERSNALMANEVLLKRIDIPYSNIFRIPAELTPAEAAKKYENTIRDFFGDNISRFDLILLGLGQDGHTASLFPGTEVIHENKDLVKNVFAEEQKMDRITMTAPLINNARNILFLVTGSEKEAILTNVLMGPYQPEKYPAQLIEPEHGEVSWFVNGKAANGHFE
jgi:6-phosphogluconolactonase